MNELEKLIEHIAADLVMVDPEDIPALAGIHENFLQLSRTVADDSGIIAIVAKNCADLIERTVLRDIESNDAALDIVNDAVTGLQTIIRDKRDSSEADFLRAIYPSSSGKATSKKFKKSPSAEENLMELETDAENDAAIEAIFRGFHTIKGAAGFLMLGPISLLAHESEILLDMARRGEIIIRGKIADAIFGSIDAYYDLPAEELIKENTIEAMALI